MEIIIFLEVGVGFIEVIVFDNGYFGLTCVMSNLTPGQSLVTLFNERW